MVGLGVGLRLLWCGGGDGGGMGLWGEVGWNLLQESRSFSIMTRPFEEYIFRKPKWDQIVTTINIFYFP